MQTANPHTTPFLEGMRPRLTNTTGHRKTDGSLKQVPVFHGKHRSVVRSNLRLADKHPRYLREGGPAV